MSSAVVSSISLTSVLLAMYILSDAPLVARIQLHFATFMVLNDSACLMH